MWIGSPHRPRARLGGGDQLQIILDALDRRHEHAEPPVARLDRERGPDHAAGLAELLLDPLLLRRVAAGDMRHRLGAAGLDRLRRLGRRLRRAAEVGQRPARHRRIDDVGIGIVRRADMRQLAERQPEADRAVAGHQVEKPAPQRPLLRPPAMALGLRLPALHRQDIPRRRGQPAVEDPRDAVALLGILELGILRRDVGRQVAFLEDPLRRILVSRRHHLGLDAELGRDALHQRLGLGRAGPGLRPFLGDQLRRPARSARRRGASRARRSSAAGSRPDTICPGRSAGSRPARSGRAAAGSACRPAPASPARPLRCSTPAPRSRRSRRRSARRPWSAARRPRRARRRPCAPSASSAVQASSENGLVMRGCSATRVTRMSKPKSTSAKDATPEIGAALR